MTLRAVLPRVALALLALGTPAWSKPPTLDRLFPAGARRGSTVTVTATGSFDHWPVQGRSDRPGLTLTAEKEKGAFTVAVAADAAPGVHWIRIFDEQGASALRPFIVGTLPEVTASKPKEGPQFLETSRVTVNGRLTGRGNVDELAVRLKKGETLVASVEANRRLGSPMDAVLQVATPAGIVLAQDDDDHGADPQIAYEVPADGTYHVRLFAFPIVATANIAFAGGPTFIYRLTLTTGGFFEYPYPLAVARSDPGQVEAHGWNVPEGARSLPVVADPTSDAATLAHAELAGTAEVRLEPHPAAVEREPNDRDHPQAIATPITITGRIEPARDVDVFEFPAKKGQPLTFRIEARTLGTPLDPVLRITDRAGKTLAEVDDTGKGRDAELNFSPPADGPYRVTVRDLHGQGGDRYVYRLTAGPPEPDYRLTLADDRFTLTPGKPLAVPVTVERKNGFNAAVEVRAEGLPDGVEASPARSDPKGPSAKTVTLTLTLKSGEPAPGPFRVVGKAVEAPARERTARIAIAGFEAMTSQAWLTVLNPERAKAEKSKK